VISVSSKTTALAVPSASNPGSATNEISNSSEFKISPAISISPFLSSVNLLFFPAMISS